MTDKRTRRLIDLLLTRTKILSKILRNFESLIDHESKFHILALLLFLITISILTYHSLAIGNIHFGSLEFHPFLNASSGYADNVYLALEGDPDKSEKSSVYTSYAPGLSCDWNKDKYRIQLSYLYEFFNYNKENIDDKKLFDLDSKLDLRFGKSGKMFDLYGGYRYRKTIDPLTSEQQADNRKEMSSKFALGFNFMDRLGLNFDSQFIQHRFMDKEPARKWNRDVTNLSSNASMRTFTKTDILFEYGMSIIEYMNPTKALYYDSKIHSILTGFEWEITEKLSGAIKAGYQWKYYKDPNGIGVSSPETWRAEVDLKHTLSEFTSLKISFERNIEDSAFKYFDRNAGFYYSNQVQFAVNHKINYKLETWLNIFYNYSTYNKVSRKDEIWNFDLGLRYQFLDWIGANLKYQSRTRNTKIESNGSFLDDVPDLDYKSNEFSVALSLTF